MKTIILDTSFLVACAEFNIDYYSEIMRILNEKYVLAIIDKTINELDSLIANGKKQALHAKLAKSILLKKKVEVIKTSNNTYVDLLILKQATPEYLVATIDVELKAELKKKNVGVIVIRQKKYLEMS